MKLSNIFNVVFTSWHNTVSKTNLVSGLVMQEMQVFAAPKKAAPMAIEDDSFPDSWN